MNIRPPPPIIVLAAPSVMERVEQRANVSKYELIL